MSRRRRLERANTDSRIRWTRREIEKTSALRWAWHYSAAECERGVRGPRRLGTRSNVLTEVAALTAVCVHTFVEGRAGPDDACSGMRQESIARS
jgi:hypothetical protein